MGFEDKHLSSSAAGPREAMGSNNMPQMAYIRSWDAHWGTLLRHGPWYDPHISP